MAKESGKSDIKQDKAMIKAMIHKHEKKAHPGKPLTKLAKGGKTNMHTPQSLMPFIEKNDAMMATNASKAKNGAGE